MLKLLTGGSALKNMDKIDAGKTIDLGQAHFTQKGKVWTIQTTKWTFTLTDLGTNAFRDSNGTFWNLQKGSRVPKFDK
ncbi:MAG: hypothetical protein LKI92_00645 [Schleiferilactobacillus harbinensis]|jgi:hypothetical protein|nr:hypothetical protein [Schleiferilactobacillus harbinensis]